MKKIGIAVAVAVIAWVAWGWLSNDEYPIRNANPAGENLICFGDSLTHGTGAPDGRSYPDQLSERIGLPVINAGVPGNTTAQALARLESDVLSQNPKIVMITIGGNDLKNGVNKETAFSNMRQIIQEIQDAGALVILAGIQLPLMDRGFGEAYENVARETGAVLIPNIYEGIMGRSHLMSDQIHPNETGYGMMAAVMEETIRPYL